MSKSSAYEPLVWLEDQATVTDLSDIFSSGKKEKERERVYLLFLNPCSGCKTPLCESFINQKCLPLPCLPAFASAKGWWCWSTVAKLLKRQRLGLFSP